MINTISTTGLNKILEKSEVVSECHFSSIDIDAKDLYFQTSLHLLSEDFKCILWVGENEEQTILTEDQKDIIYYYLLNAESQDSQFDPAENEHALTLIHS